MCVCVVFLARKYGSRKMFIILKMKVNLTGKSKHECTSSKYLEEKCFFRLQNKTKRNKKMAGWR